MTDQNTASSLPEPGPTGPSRTRTLRAALRRALFGVGPLATAKAMLRRAVRVDPELARQHSVAPPPQHPFDAAFGVDTGGFRSWRELQAGHANDPYISGYLGIAPSVGRRAIGYVSAPENYTFIDYGCGKGRALIVASERPFRRVIGLEIAADLAATARRNASIMRASHPERPSIEIIEGDAASFVPPPGPLVLFFYQPFEMPVMRQVIAQFSASLNADPRPAVVIYVHPVLGRAFDGSPLLDCVVETSLELEVEERPFAYGGRGEIDGLKVWRTRKHPPPLR